MKKIKPRKPRSLVVQDMIRRSISNGGRMRDRRLRRPHDVRHNEIILGELV